MGREYNTCTMDFYMDYTGQHGPMAPWCATKVSSPHFCSDITQPGGWGGKPPSSSRLILGLLRGKLCHSIFRHHSCLSPLCKLIQNIIEQRTNIIPRILLSQKSAPPDTATPTRTSSSLATATPEVAMELTMWFARSLKALASPPPQNAAPQEERRSTGTQPTAST